MRFVLFLILLMQPALSMAENLEDISKPNIRDELLLRLSAFSQIHEIHKSYSKDNAGIYLSEFRKISNETRNIITLITKNLADKEIKYEQEQEQSAELSLLIDLQAYRPQDSSMIDPFDMVRYRASTLHKSLSLPLNTIFPKGLFPTDHLLGNEKLIDLLSDDAVLEFLRYLPQSTAEYQKILGKEVFPESPEEQEHLTKLLNKIKTLNYVDSEVVLDEPQVATEWWNDIGDLVRVLPFESIQLLAHKNYLMMSPFRCQVMLSAGRYAKDGTIELSNPIHVLNLRAYIFLLNSRNPFREAYLNLASKMIEGLDDPSIAFLMNRFSLRPLAAIEYLINLLNPDTMDNAAIELLAWFPPAELDKLAEEFRLTKIFRTQYSYHYYRVLEVLSHTASLLSYLHNTPPVKRTQKMKSVTIDLLETRYIDLRNKFEAWEKEIDTNYSLGDFLWSFFNVPNSGQLQKPSFYTQYPKALIGNHMGFEGPFCSLVDHSREIGEIGRYLDEKKPEKAVIIAMNWAYSSNNNPKFKVKGFYLVMRLEHPIFDEYFIKRLASEPLTNLTPIALFLGNTKEEAKRSIQLFHESMPISGPKIRGFYRFAIPPHYKLPVLDNELAAYIRPVFKNGKWALEQFDPTRGSKSP